MKQIYPQLNDIQYNALSEYLQGNSTSTRPFSNPLQNENKDDYTVRDIWIDKEGNLKLNVSEDEWIDLMSAEEYAQNVANEFEAHKEDYLSNELLQKSKQK